MRRSLSFFAMASLLTFSLPARAFEKQHHLGGGVAPSLLAVRNDSVSPGIGLHAHYAYGVNDMFNFVVEGGGTLFPISQDKVTDPKVPKPEPRPSLLGHLSTGVIYNLDVVKIVPYGGVLVGGYTFAGGGFDKVNFAAGAQLALGIDWHSSRKFALGFGFRQHFLLTKITDYPSYSQLVIRAEYKWGG